MEKILIVGGNAAGLAAASRVRRVDPRLNVTVVEKLSQIAYSTCGAPYFLEGMTTADDLIAYTPEAFEKERGVHVHPNIQIESILPGTKRCVGSRADTKEKVEFAFDRLLLATGVRPRLPDIPGVDLGNVFTVTQLQDAVRIREAWGGLNSAAVIGAGYVGLEMTESLLQAGKSVTLFEREPHVLSSVDPDMARIVEYELQRHGVNLRTGSRVLALTGESGRVSGVKSASGLGVTPVDMVLVSAGVIPNVALARDAGIRIGATGGIAVDARMETNVPGIFAAGNCAETTCLVRQRPVLNYLGTVAAKQGRVAGDNLAGRRTTFRGAVGTTVLKVFELNVARAGLTSREAAEERISFVAPRIEALDRASYYPGAGKLWMKLLVDRASRKVIGAQAVGYGDAARRVDVAAAAITAGMRIDDVAQLDLGYAPPFGSLWDPLLVAAQAAIRAL
ncbi:MAG TPA: FAD-dependent oxidoreductase [Terriglobia bacterium]|nr:FAD-dependent oxidoreductase [Terriglobia bacterium]